MASFQDLQNIALWRLRARGANFVPGTPGNLPTDQNPPYLVQQLLNMGYSEFLSRTLEAQIATLKTSFLTTANATNYPLRPLPNTPAGAPNPAVMRVFEATYITATGGPNAGYEYEIELCSTKRFAFYAGDYTRRLSWFGPRVLYAARLYRRPFLECLPGTATAGDTITVTVVPDPNLTPITVPAYDGGPLQLPTDVPLFPQEFHMALVEYVVMNAGDAANKDAQAQAAAKKWEDYVQRALAEGSTDDGGDPTVLVDKWAPVAPLARAGLD